MAQLKPSHAGVPGAGDPSVPAAAPSPLPTATQEAIDRIPEEDLREQVTVTMQLSLQAFAAFEAARVPADVLAHVGDKASDDLVATLAPQLLGAVRAANVLLRHLTQAYPATEALPDPDDDASAPKFDLVVAAVDIGVTETLGPAAAAHQGPVGTTAQRLAEVAHGLSASLRARLLSLAEKLRVATPHQEDWLWLGVVDEHQQKLCAAIASVVFCMLGVHAPDAHRSAVLPGYQGPLTKAVAARAALCQLGDSVRTCHTALLTHREVSPLTALEALNVELTRFCLQPAYHGLRADDKNTITQFRRAHVGLLHRLTDSAEGDDLRGSALLALEEFTAFLDAMSVLNAREVLVAHDKRGLQDVLDRLERATDATSHAEGLAALDAAVHALAKVRGRSAELDEARRTYTPPSRDALPGALIRWRALVEEALAPL